MEEHSTVSQVCVVTMRILMNGDPRMHKPRRIVWERQLGVNTLLCELASVPSPTQV